MRNDPAPAITMPEVFRPLKVALVHDYLNQAGGAERVFAVFTDMFPGAPIFTAVYDRDRMPDFWKSLDVRTSFMQRFAARSSISRAMLPLYPTAFESFDLKGFDLVLSSATTFAKGVITRPSTCHVCYCANPTRFLWMYHSYLEHERLPPGARAVLPWVATILRPWDFAAAQRVDHFIAGSHNAAGRISKYYRRPSDVLQPPIDVSQYHIASRPNDDFLIVSRLQPYKRIDLAVLACTRLGLPLRVVGDGPDRARLQRLAGPTVTFLGRVPDEAVRDELARCKALLLPGEEDFGLTPLEAQASGRPVIAFAAGGALETVCDGKTGVFFREQNVEAIARALSDFEDDFDPQALRAHAATFDVPHFKRSLYALLARYYEEHREAYTGGIPRSKPAPITANPVSGFEE